MFKIKNILEHPRTTCVSALLFLMAGILMYNGENNVAYMLITAALPFLFSKDEVK